MYVLSLIISPFENTFVLSFGAANAQSNLAVLYADLSACRVGKMDWADRWLESKEFALVKSEIIELKAKSLANAPTVASESRQAEYATSFLYQLSTVSSRTHLAFYRDPQYGFTRLFNHISISLALGLTFLNLTNSLVSLQYRVFMSVEFYLFSFFF